MFVRILDSFSGKDLIARAYGIPQRTFPKQGGVGLVQETKPSSFSFEKSCGLPRKNKLYIKILHSSSK